MPWDDNSVHKYVIEYKDYNSSSAKWFSKGMSISGFVIMPGTFFVFGGYESWKTRTAKTTK